MSDFKAKMHQNLISAGALPQTPELDLRGPTRKGKGYRKGGGGGQGGEGREGKMCCVPVRMIHYITTVTQYS